MYIYFSIILQKYFTNLSPCCIIGYTKYREVTDMTKVIIMEGNGDFAKEIAEQLTREGMEISGVTDDGSVGLEYVRQFSADVVVVGMVLKEIDGFGVLDKLKEIPGKRSVIAIGNFSDDALISKALSKGAKYYLMKPVSAELIAERVKEMTGEVKPAGSTGGFRERRMAASMDEKISNIFISIGIPASIKGYGYLREGVKMAVENPSIINNITKELYPKIAEKFSTTPSKVERAIRHSIEVAFNKGRIDAINSIFGVRVYIGTEKPTNSEFIALLADKLLLDAASGN